MKIDWNSELEEMYKIFFYSFQMILMYFTMKKIKGNRFSLGRIGSIIGLSIVIPVLSYSFIGESAHLSMIISCLILGVFLKPDQSQ